MQSNLFTHETRSPALAQLYNKADPSSAGQKQEGELVSDITIIVDVIIFNIITIITSKIIIITGQKQGGEVVRNITIIIFTIIIFAISIIITIIIDIIIITTGQKQEGEMVVINITKIVFVNCDYK